MRRCCLPVYVSMLVLTISSGLLAQTGENIALLGTASQSSTCVNVGASLAIDGNLGNFTHTCNDQRPAILEVDLGVESDIGAVVLHNRDSCCYSRLRDIIVSVHDIPFTEDVILDSLLEEAADFELPLWDSAFHESDLLNPENVLAGPEVIVLDLDGLDVSGRYVRVTRLPDVDRSGSDGLGGAADDPIVLSLGEVEVYETGLGCPPDGDTHCTGLDIQGPPNDFAGAWSFTASGTDDSGDPITWTFTAEHELGTVVSAADATGTGLVTLNLLETGNWTVTATADDDAVCQDEAFDATCSETVVVVETPGSLDFLGRIRSPDFLVLGPFQLTGQYECGAADLLRNFVAPTFLGCEYPLDGDEVEYDPLDPEQASLAYMGPTSAGGAPIWVLLDDGSDDGDIDFQGLPTGPLDDVVAFAATYITNAGQAPLAVDLCVQSDDGVQVWLDDRPVGSDNACRGRGGIADPACQDTLPVFLSPGPHRIILGVWERGDQWGARLGVRIGGVPVVDNGTTDLVFHGTTRPADPASFPCREVVEPLVLDSCIITEEGLELTWTNAAATPVVIRVNGLDLETVSADTTSFVVPVGNLVEGTNAVCLDNAGLVPVCCSVELDAAGGLCQQAARGGVATQTTTCFDSPPERAIDGLLDNYTHTCFDEATPAVWELDLGSTQTIRRITIHNRQSCCGSRLRDVVVSVHDIPLSLDVPLDPVGDILDVDFPLWEDALYESDPLNEENEDGVFPGGPPLLEVDLAGLDVSGQYVRITRIPDTDLSGTGGQGNADEARVLSLAEVEVCVGEGGGVVTTPEFIRGDADANGAVNITDGIFILNFLFLGGPSPGCLDSADGDDDGSVSITDGIYVLNFLFLGGPGPAPPHPACGTDPQGDGDGVTCQTSHPGC